MLIRDTSNSTSAVSSQNITQNRREFDDDQVGIPDRPKFQQIEKQDAWVFSAFYDTVNNKRLIRVFGIQSLQVNDTILCYMNENGTTVKTIGKRTLLQDNHGNRRRIFSYECEVGNSSRPSTVSIVFNQSDTPTNTIKVFYPLPLQRNFTVCHASLYNYNNYKQLVQSVEFNRVLGAEHIFIYKMNVTNETDAVIKLYQKQRFLTVIEWPLPFSEVHYYGQILSVNDCVYRNKGVSRFVVILDTDEFIIPNHHDNWFDLIAEIDKYYYGAQKKSDKKLATYIFESTFFQDRPNSSEWAEIKFNNSLTSEQENIMEKHALTVLTHVKRLNITFGQARQKSIIRPELILFSDVHTTFSHRVSAIDVKVNVNLSLVHHQRKWDNSENCVVEVTSWRFLNRLVPLVNHTFNELAA